MRRYPVTPARGVSSTWMTSKGGTARTPKAGVSTPSGRYGDGAATRALGAAVAPTSRAGCQGAGSCAISISTFAAAWVPRMTRRSLAGAEADAIRNRVAGLDLYRLARLQTPGLSRNRRNLVSWSAMRVTVTGVPMRALQERVVAVRLHRAVGAGDGIAVRIDGGMAEHGVHAVDQAVGHHVLELLGVVVDVGPAHAHDLDQELLDQAMTPQDHGGQLGPGRR